MVSERGQSCHSICSLTLKSVVNSVMQMKSLLCQCDYMEQGGIAFLAVNHTS